MREGAPKRKAKTEAKPSDGESTPRKLTRTEKILKSLSDLGPALKEKQGEDEFKQTDFQMRGAPDFEHTVPQEPLPAETSVLGADVDESGVVNPYLQSGVTSIEDPDARDAQESTASFFEQVETKKGAAYTPEDETPKLGREMPRQTAVDEGPLVQVETRKSDEELYGPIPIPNREQVPTLTDAVYTPPIIAGEGPTEDITAREHREKFAAKVREYDDQVKKYLSERRAETNPVVPTPEKKGAFEGLSGYLKERVQTLDALAGKIGIEQKFRAMGEWYNGRSWGTKLAVGLGLGIGAGATAALSFPTVAAILYGGIIVQRTAGLASEFLKYEKSTQEGKWKKEIAMTKAVGKGLFMLSSMYALTEGTQRVFGYAREHGIGERIGEWFKHHSPFGGSAQAPESPPVPQPPTEAAPQLDTGVTLGRMPESPLDYASISTDEPSSVEASAPAFDHTEASMTPTNLSDLKIGATQGKGYEYMMKKLWEQMQERHLDPKQFAEGSDARKLLEATPGTIDKIVHQIAADPTHSFVHPDGSSATVDLSAKIWVGNDGLIHFSDAIRGDRIKA